MRLTLHNFFRSSASTRVRIALNLKGLDYAYVSYVLRNGEQRGAAYLALNPAGLVPALEREDGVVLSQSLAIAEWLDETHPDNPLLPPDADGRARVRGLAQMIACDLHPVNNLRVLAFLKTAFGASEEAQASWFRHWVALTYEALEVRLTTEAATGRYCHGEAPGLADICLYAQEWNNRRFAVDTSPYPTIRRIAEALEVLPAFRDAAPPNQPDAA